MPMVYLNKKIYDGLVSRGLDVNEVVRECAEKKIGKNPEDKGKEVNE